MDKIPMRDLMPQSEHPLLSIAIPTFNRAKYLDQLLTAILGQVQGDPRVEVLVSDNASTDETPSVLERHLRQNTSIHYIRNQANQGPDFNILQCYEESRGKYVWIFGDDDLILDGGLTKILSLLENEELDFVFIAPYAFHYSVCEINPRRDATIEIIDSAIVMVSRVNLYSDLIFISAGIINKNYVSEVMHQPFLSLLGTNLIQLGWILTSLRHFRRGAFLYPGILAARAGNSSGGFKAAKVFGEHFRSTISAMLDADSDLFKKIVSDHLRIWFPRNWIQFRRTDKDVRAQHTILRATFHRDPQYWFYIYPLVQAPIYLAKMWAMMLRGPIHVRMAFHNVLSARVRGTFASSKSAQRSSVTDMRRTPRVAALIVLYYPDLERFEQLLTDVIDQVDHIVTLDNTPEPDRLARETIERFHGRISYVSLGDNMGIATAQNIGIEMSMKKGYSHVLFLDQDSIPSPQMVPQLLAAEQTLLDSGKNVAAVGPQFIDEKTGRSSPAVRHHSFRIEKISLNPASAVPVETDYLISSGSLVRIAVFQHVGTMFDELFIDWVDIEWGMRARAKGYVNYYVPNIIMQHSVGDSIATVFGRDVHLHNDLRHYYILRNAIYLFRLRSMGWRWKINFAPRIPYYLCLFILLSDSKWKSCNILFRAIWDGLLGKHGRLAEK